jgi:hypothetical protein
VERKSCVESLQYAKMLFTFAARKSGNDPSAKKGYQLASGSNYRMSSGVLVSYPDGVRPKQTEEHRRFENALRQVLQVSKTDLNQMLADEKAGNAGKPKRGPKPKSLASGRASSDKG